MTTEKERLNMALHRLFGQDVKPCETACTHVIAGQWTALGAANVLSRVASREQTQ